MECEKTILFGSPPAPTMKLMIHPFIQHLLGTYCVPVCQARESGVQGLNEDLPSTAHSLAVISQGKCLCRWSFLGQAIYLLLSIYHKMKTNFRYGCY